MVQLILFDSLEESITGVILIIFMQVIATSFLFYPISFVLMANTTGWLFKKTFLLFNNLVARISNLQNSNLMFITGCNYKNVCSLQYNYNDKHDMLILLLLFFFVHSILLLSSPFCYFKDISMMISL